uniref:Ribonuclease H protein At1g65750 family n=1 Tax=Cajanus cajan TaxID=3821 RepID=A0A151TTU6_CAJCA|nr:Putative ribonuclease H protein At1g65750 family [Cajanus cajan]
MVETSEYNAKRRLWAEHAIWSPSEHPWVKLNTDGSWLRGTSAMGLGGAIRDWAGMWRGGFSRGVLHGDALCAELLALEDGLAFCWEGGFRKVSCECDCLGAVTLFQDRPMDRDYLHKHYDVIRRIKGMLAREWIVHVSHIPREINSVAHTLAN